MPLTELQEAHALWSSIGAEFTLHISIQCDERGYLTGALAPGATTATVSQSVADQVQIGDVIQIERELMLVSQKFGSVLLFSREYSGTKTPAGLTYLADTACWVWRDFTGRFSNAAGIVGIRSLRRSFERSLYKFETNLADLQAWNTDRFWNRLTYGQGLLLGFSSLRHRRLRVFIKSKRGAIASESYHKPLATMLIDRILTNESGIATLKLLAMNAPMADSDYEGALAKNGTEIHIDTPDWEVFRSILEAYDLFRTTNGPSLRKLPMQTQRMLTTLASRRLALPAGAPPLLSPVGRVDEYQTQGGVRYRSFSPPSGSVVGHYGAAIARDPQCNGAGNVKTGDVTRAGRVFFARGCDIWEWDPDTNDSARVFIGGSAIPTKRIVALWYDATLTPSTSGLPKICGIAVADYPNSGAAGYGARGASATFFVWHGNGSAFERSLIDSNLFPGTHFFRDGKTYTQSNTYHELGANNVDIVNPPENLSLPFSQRIYGAYANVAGTPVGDPPVDWDGNYRIQARRGDSFAAAEGSIHSHSFRDWVVRDDGGQNLDVGIDIEAPGKAEYLQPATNTTSLRTIYHALKVRNASFPTFGPGDPYNCRFTQGASGCFGFSNDPAAGVGWMVYAQINTTTGVISIRAMRTSDMSNFLLYTLPDKDYQPCSAAGNFGYGVSGANNPIFLVGYVRWRENTRSESFIDRFSLSGTTFTRTNRYDSTTEGATDSKYATPLAIGMCNSQLTPAVAVTWLRRHRLGENDQYVLKAYDPLSGSAWSSYGGADFYPSRSQVHAYTPDNYYRGSQSTNGLWAVDTGGRVIFLRFNTVADLQSIDVIDRGHAPVEGEHWSATRHVAPATTDAGVVEGYGISAPVWPHGPDIRGGKYEGRWSFWQLKNSIVPIVELASFKGMNGERACAVVAYGSNLIFGWDEMGDFMVTDRVSTATPEITLRSGGDRTTMFSMDVGWTEFANQIDMAPVSLRIGAIEPTIILASTSRTKKGQPFDLQSIDGREKTVVLKCTRGGRVNVAAFAAYAQTGVLKAWTSDRYLAGTSYSTIEVSADGTAAAGPLEWTDPNNRGSLLMIPYGSRMQMPDGQIKTVSTLNPSLGTHRLIIVLNTAWVPTMTAYPGHLVQIDLSVARQTTNASMTTSDVDGYQLTSSFEWQEIGLGQAWATGVMIRFFDPPDDGKDLNWKERAWAAGETIIIRCSGAEVVSAPGSIITSTDSDSIAKWKRKVTPAPLAMVSIKRADYLGQSHLLTDGWPRPIFTADTFLCPHIPLWTNLACYSRNLIPTAPYTWTMTLRAIDMNFEEKRSTLELIGPRGVVN